jgi:GTPase SAR1 family protein
MENSQYTFSLMDLNVTASVSDDYRVIMDAYIAGADGIILLYDVTNRDSFDRVTNETYVHIWGARNTVFRKQGDTGKMEGLKKRFGCVVVGNKSDLVGEDEAKRRIENGEAGDWAESQGFRAFEVSSNERVEVEDVVKALVKSVRKVNWMDDQDDRDSRDAGKGSDSKRSVGALLKKALGGVK